MASTLLVKDALYRASILLGDIQPSQFTRWKERELVMHLNDGQRAIAKFIPTASSRIDAIKLASGTKQSIASIPAANILPGDGSASVNTRGLMLVDVIRNLGTDGATPGQAIRVIPREVQDNINGLWHANYGTGTVEHYIFDPRMPRDFYVVPAVSQTVATWIEVSYVISPQDIALPGSTSVYGWLGTDGTTISIDDVYIDDLVNYIAARAFLKDAEFGANSAMAQMYTQLFVGSLNAQVQMMTGTNPNISFLPFAPQPLSQAH